MWNIRSIRTADKRVLYFQMEWNLFQSYIMDIRTIKHSTVDLWTCTIYLDLDGAISLKWTQQTKTSDPDIKSDYMCHLLVKGNMYCFVSISDVPKMLKQYKENYPFYHPISYKYYFTKYCLTFSVWLSFLLSKHHNNCYLWIYLVDISTALHWHCPPRPGCTAAVLQHVGCWALPAPAQVRVSWQQDGDGKAEKLSSATLAQGSSI